jgi:hypothetical protein
MPLADIIQFIKENRNNGKRTCFDIEHLQDWIEWALDKDYLFVSKDTEQITGVLTVCPIGKWSEAPNMEQVIDNMGKNHTDTDYFIMDALTSTAEARRELVNKALARFKDIESNPETQLYASVKNGIIKFNKQTILTLKN